LIGFLFVVISRYIHKQKHSKYMKPISHTHVTETIDNGTGEVSKTKSVSVLRVDQEPAFVKMYIEDIIRLSNLNNITKNLLISLTKRIDYENKIKILPNDKREIAAEIGTKHIQTVANSLSMLVKAGIIVRTDRGGYMLSPNYFAKGKWVDIKDSRVKYTELTIQYSKTGKRKVNNKIVFDDGGEMIDLE